MIPKGLPTPRLLGPGLSTGTDERLQETQQAGDVLVAHDIARIPVTIELALKDIEQPKNATLVQTQSTLDGIGDNAGEGGGNGACRHQPADDRNDQAGRGGNRQGPIPIPRGKFR